MDKANNKISKLTEKYEVETADLQKKRDQEVADLKTALATRDSDLAKLQEENTASKKRLEELSTEKEDLAVSRISVYLFRCNFDTIFFITF